MTNKKTRQKRIRAKISGTKVRPRISIFKSNKYIYIQAINDASKNTIASVNTNKATVEDFAKKLKDLKIQKVVFDRSGYQYHGKIKEIAEKLRKTGLEF
ncbi:MAG: ribosomal protein [Candidatus Berkelbacteria bacterium]|nr:ribosomal protein [Candidatus Berkelbacteria bacterium]